MKFLTIVFAALFAVNTHANPVQIVDCNKVASTAAAGIYQMYTLGDTRDAAHKVFSALPEASKNVGLNEAELIVATGIVANVSVFGAKQIYKDLGLTKENKERKLQSTRNVFYMFCNDSFRAKKYY